MRIHAKKSCYFYLFICIIFNQILSAQPKHTKLLYYDPLDNTKSTAAGTISAKGGKFIPGVGWQTVYNTNQLLITLPEPLPFEGTLEVELTNFDPWNQNNIEGLKQHIINLWSRKEADKSVYETDAAWINVRTQKNNAYSDGNGMIGFKFLTQPRGVERREEDYVMTNAKWRTDKKYRFKIIWTPKKAYVFVDNILRATNDFSGQVEPFRYIFLGKDNVAIGYCSQIGPIWSNLRIYINEPAVEAPLKFADITVAAKVKGYSIDGFAQSVSFADVNHDGKPDFFVSNATATQATPDLLYINQGANLFKEEAQSRSIADIGFTKGMLIADFNGDGYLDSFFGNTPLKEGDASGRNTMYYNNGSGFFTNVSDKVGISQISQPTNGVLALDVDNDGDLDLFTVNPGKPNELYINDGFGAFRLETRGVEQSEESINEFGRHGAVCGDIDQDGDIDIYVCRSQEGTTDARNWLFINDGSGHFTEEALSRGVAAGGRSYGATFIDIDNDADHDLFVIKYNVPIGPIPNLGVFINDGNGHYLDQTEDYDIIVAGYTAVFGDVNNDGYPDMLLLGNNQKNSETRPKLYLNAGTGKFTLALNSGLEIAAADLRGGAYADIDSDGDIDFYLTCAKGQNYLFRNDQQTNNHYLRVLCYGPLGDFGGTGSKIFLYKTGHLGDNHYLLGYQEAGLQFGYMCQNEGPLHFGLGSELTCDMRVILIDGQILDYRSINADQFFTVRAKPSQKVLLTVLVGNDQKGIVGQPLPDSVSVLAKDRSGQAVANYPLSLAVTDAAGLVNGDTLFTVKTNSVGIASFCWTLGGRAGRQVVGVTSADTSFKLSARAGAGPASTIIKVGGDNQNCSAGVEFPMPFSVRVEDIFGNPVPDQLVQFDVIDGGGHLLGLIIREEKTDSSGIAQVFWTTGPYLGPPNRLEAKAKFNDEDLNGSPVVWRYQIEIIDLNTSTITATTPVEADGISLSLITVTLMNTLQLPAASGYTVQIMVSGSENTVAIQDTLTNAQGQVSARLSSTRAEKKVVSVWIKGLNTTLASHAEIIFAKTDIPADSLVLVDGDGQTGTVNQVLQKPFKIQVQSPSKKPLPDFDVRFVVMNGNGKLNGKDTTWIKSDANGYAQCLLRLGIVAGHLNHLVAVWTDGARNAPIFLRASATPDQPMRLIKVSGDNQSVNRSQTALDNLQVAVFDQFNNPVPDIPVQFSAVSTGQIITPQPVITDSIGHARCRVAGPEIAGVYYFKADASNRLSVIFKLVVTPNMPPQIIAYVPMQTEISSSHTNTIDFAITRAQDGNGDVLNYAWFVNGELFGRDSSYALVPSPQMGTNLKVEGLVFDQWDTVKITWRVSIVMTETAGNKNVGQPKAWALLPNHPNPFNPTTTYMVEAANQQDVEIKIYALNGRLVKILYKGVLAPGQYSYIWDGTDENGQQQSSGIYLCVLRAGTCVQTQRTVLVK